jgi:hypothetical protein
VSSLPNEADRLFFERMHQPGGEPIWPAINTAANIA